MKTLIRAEDASHFKGEADELLLPETEEQIASILRQASLQKKPVTVCGARTGLTGAAVPLEGMLLSTEKMSRILRITEETAVVQPGVSLKSLEEALEPRGLFYPPDPGEKMAFLGGNVSTNASGPRSLKYGSTRRWVRRLKVVLPTGDRLELRRGQQRAEGGLLPLTLAGGHTLRVPIPTYAVPQTKNSAGYFAAPEMDAVDLFIGAEGTLGIVTEVEVGILRKPEAVLSGILFFDDEWDCFAFAQEARRMSARALEFFDSRSLAFLSRKHTDIPARAGAALYFQRECAQAEFHRLLEEWSSRSEEFGARPSDSWFGHQEQDLQLFRRLRYDLPVMVNEQATRNGFRKLGTDLAVPEPQGKGMFKIYLQDLPSCGVEFLIWGHLGEDHLHVNFLPKRQAQMEKALALYAQWARLAVQLGGTVAAEHGIGKSRIPYLEMMVGREGLKQMARVKKALDPAGILNRGNLFPAELLDHA